jgi:hypothetical protein
MWVVDVLVDDPAARTANEAREIKRKLSKLRRPRVVIRAFEATEGDQHGWHPHQHMFFIVNRKLTREEAASAMAPVWDRWCTGLAAQGLTAIADINGESAGFRRARPRRDRHRPGRIRGVGALPVQAGAGGARRGVQARP